MEDGEAVESGAGGGRLKMAWTIQKLAWINSACTQANEKILPGRKQQEISKAWYLRKLRLADISSSSIGPIMINE